MSLVSGKLELDFCFYASNNTPAKPRFAALVDKFTKLYPEYLVAGGDIQQIFLPISKEQFEVNDELGRVVSLIEGTGYSIVKKMTIEVALKQSDEDLEGCYNMLYLLQKSITTYQHEGLTTTRIVLTSFVSEEIAA